MFEDGWVFDVLKGFGEYGCAGGRGTRPRRTQAAHGECEYEEEDLDDLLDDVYEEEQEE